MHLVNCHRNFYHSNFRGDINTQEIQAKAAAALQWCKHASDFTASVGGKSWKYLLVPHDEVNETRQLTDFLRLEVKD